MNQSELIELGLNTPHQWHLHIKALLCDQEPDCNSCYAAPASRCVGVDGLGTATERLTTVLQKIL